MITTITGPNDFLRQAAVDKIVADFIGKYGDVALERLAGDEDEFQQIYDSLTNLPFLASKKMVIVKSPNANKQFGEEAAALINNLPDSTDLVIVEPKFDKRSNLYKLLKKNTDYREFETLEANDLANWIGERAKTLGGEINLSDARFLVDRVGPNQQLLVGELDKLLLFDSKISRQSIELLSEPAPQSTIFELLDAALSGNSKKALSLYDDQRALKVEPLQIVAMLAWQLHVVALVQAATNISAGQIASQAKINPFVVNKSLSIARRLSSNQVKAMIRELLELDVRFKSENIDADEALRLYLLNL